MINVTRLNGKPYIINAIYIETIESFPDTTITLSNGRKYVVKESEEEVVQLVIKFYQTVNLLGLQQMEGPEHEK
ncbi:flagellar FlbD family protein [Robertmurraya massiliosenegalensis]|uniref:flagellar FlbD family protein n=1 Tax=Robertmurraya TaxID=2837507 RepID=UPI0039A57CC5